MSHYKIKIFIVLLLSLALFYGCESKEPTSPDVIPDVISYFSKRRETQNFIFHYSSGDYVEPKRQESFHRWATRQLGVTCPKKIDFYKYLNRYDIKKYSGKEGNAWADPEIFEIHTIWSWDNHECIHCYTSLIGRPSDFFNEGIAVGMSTNPYNNNFEAIWWSESVHYWARRFKNEGTLIPLDNILETDSFRSYDDTITYPESGSFVRFMIDNYSLDNMISFFRIGDRYDSKSTIKLNFLSIYKFTFKQAENEWLEFLDNYSGN